MPVYEVANCENGVAAGRALTKHLPRDIKQQISFAVAATQQENQRIVGQLLDRMAPAVDGPRFHRFGRFSSAVVRNRTHPAGATIRLHRLPNKSRTALSAPADR